MSGGLPPTKLSLAAFARFMGINPLHFMGVQIPQMQTRGCDIAWYQYPWQTAHLISREDVADAIRSAEQLLEAYLGYRMLPTWEAGERVQTTRVNDPVLVGGYGPILANPVGMFIDPGGDERGYRNTVVANWKRFITGGVRATTLLAATSPITWSNTHPPTAYNNLGTVTATVPAGTDPTQVRIFYPGKAAAETWAITPISVDVTGTVATITFARELCVIEAILESMDRQADSNDGRIANGLVDADFLEAVDVYRVYNDPATMAQLLWEPGPGFICDPATGLPDADAFVTTDGMLSTGNPKLGILNYQRGSWDASTSKWVTTGGGEPRYPDQLIINYRAGYQDPAATNPWTDLDPFLAKTTAILAASLLNNTGCKCSAIIMGRWQADLAISAGNDGGSFSRYQVTPAILECPWGTRRGAWQAWASLQRESVYAPIQSVFAF